MKAEEIFKEVIKDPIFQSKYGISEKDLENETINENSQHRIIEIVKSIIRGEAAKSDKKSIFRHVQNKIMQL